MIDPDRTPRILITRLSALGDCLLTLPLVAALRDHFPNAFITWAMEPLAARLLAGHPFIDKMIPVPKKWLKSPREVVSLRRKLQAMRFHFSIDPQSLTKSSMLGWLSDARRRIGFSHPQGRELAPWLNTDLVDRSATHLVDASLRLLEPLGIESPSARFELPIDQGADRCVEQFIQNSHLSGGFSVINIGATNPSRVWLPERFGRVARFLGEECDTPTVVTWAGDSESELATRAVARSGGHAIQAPATSLLELSALLRRARLTISGDTGPLHLASAVGTPCVGLYGPTRPEWSGPYGPQHVTVGVNDDNARGWLARRGKRHRRDNSAMLAISVEDVGQAAAELLRNPRKSTISHCSTPHAA